MDSNYIQLFEELLSLAEKYRGATAPNPCVGALALDPTSGKVLSLQAHQKAGNPHAEALVIADLENLQDGLTQAKVLLVSLEPCSHRGRTGPCTQAIIKAHQEFGAFEKVFFLCRDQNSKVSGLGMQILKQAGIDVHCVEEENPELQIVKRGRALLRPFFHFVKTGKPWVTLKTAINTSGTLIPAQGQKTFTSEASLELSHRLRKRADAILTGSGTVLADAPLLTVRLVQDHPDKQRWLVILDRKKRVSEAYLQQARGRGFKVLLQDELERSLDFLGAQGCLEVLVEAGPTLTRVFLEKQLWDEQILIRSQPTGPDRIEVVLKKSYD
jgi:diaminohydroxyphosphoribosylaminopyrimidine deaminase/5-amino-6-(5-phosphoribosylamino)uracil reductase